MKILLLAPGKIVLENEVVTNQYLYIEDHRIKEIGPLPHAEESFPGAVTISLSPDDTVLPGFIDLHIHGAGGADTMDATPEALRTIASSLAAEGTTSFLATTITQSKEKMEAALKNAADYSGSDGAEMLGVHLEGPFINEKRAGAQPRHYITEPDLELFDRWQTLAGGLIKVVTVAPELENGIDFVAHLRKQDVIASIGHSDAVYDEVKRAVEAGASQITHLYNGMRGMHHREPGVAGAALLFKELLVELIADGIHIEKEMLKLSVKAKGPDGFMLITDSMRAKCLKSGLYELGGQEVTVADGKALLADGTLAGSILKMNDGVKNIIEFADVTLLEAVKMASGNPARQLKVDDRKGSIRVHKDADITVLDKDFQVVLTLCRGKNSYNRGDLT